MADKRHSVTIDSISCKGTGGSDGDDEVFILYQVDAGMPVRHPVRGNQKMNKSADSKNNVVQTWKPGLTLNFDHEVLVTLLDQDTLFKKSGSDFDGPDFLVNVEYRADYFSASYEMTNNNGAHYVIDATKHR
jgi:hypothetical protein